MLTLKAQGVVKSIIDQLDRSERSNYFCIRDALLASYNQKGKKVLRKAEYRKRSKFPSETYEQYARDLRRLAKDAVPDLDPEAMDSIVSEKFLEGLPRVVSLHVQLHIMRHMLSLCPG
jgi:hypothetical protein